MDQQQPPCFASARTATSRRRTRLRLTGTSCARYTLQDLQEIVNCVLEYPMVEARPFAELVSWDGPDGA